jgi:alpha-1,6-mannosyltransferase
MGTRAGHAVAGRLALAGLVVSGSAICLYAAAGPSALIPSGWLAEPLPGLGDGLTSGAFSALFVVMCACYLAALAFHLPPRATVAAIGVLHLLFMLGPPLLSSDVFGYITWARLGVIHGLDPYSHGSLSVPDDPAAHHFIWHTDMASPYGPLFTLASYATAPLGVAGALWAFKVACAAASLGCVALVASCARLRGIDPVRAAAFVGLNPLVLVWAVGGAHNDLIAVVVVLAGVWLVLRERDRLGGAALTVAPAIKASAGVVLPYALLGTRGRALPGALLAATAVAALALAVFGSDITGLLETQREQQQLVAHTSVPNQLGILVGAGGITPAIRTLALTALIATLLWTLLITWRGADWIACAGWATFALIACSAWFMPWYLVWLLPLAAIARDRRLTIATLALCAYAVVMRTPF